MGAPTLDLRRGGVRPTEAARADGTRPTAGIDTTQAARRTNLATRLHPTVVCEPADAVCALVERADVHLTGTVSGSLTVGDVSLSRVLVGGAEGLTGEALCVVMII